MNFPNALTGWLAAFAAVQGARTAPVTPEPPGVFQIDSIRNCESPLPAHLLRSLDRNYEACAASGVFAPSTPLAQELLCLVNGVIDTAFKASLGEPLSSDIATLREGLHRMLRSRSRNPLRSPVTAEHSLKRLRHINFIDYQKDRPAKHADGIERVVNVLQQHVPLEQRGSVADARAAARAPGCQKALDATLPSLVRAEVSERRALVTLREIRDPQSISAEQADLLRQNLDHMVFDPSPMKQRMLTDALEALVARSGSGRVIP